MSYRLLDETALASQIADMRVLIGQSQEKLAITQDLGIGMMLWMSHFFPVEQWAVIQRSRGIATLGRMWVNDAWFCREPGLHDVEFAFTNYGVSIGLQAVGSMPDRVDRLHAFFETYRSGDEYDLEAITHVIACSAHFPGAST